MAPRKRTRNADGTFSSAGGSQTGGTGDIKPQVMTVTTPPGAGANDFSSVAVTVPRIMMGGRGYTTIMEVLRVDWYPSIENNADLAATYGVYLSTRLIRAQDSAATAGGFAADFSDPTTFANAILITNLLTSGANGYHLPISIDMTDNNGNGYLLATDRFFMTSGQVNDAVPSSTICKILYRMVNVGIEEYVGIVQSQFA